MAIDLIAYNGNRKSGGQNENETRKELSLKDKVSDYKKYFFRKENDIEKVSRNLRYRKFENEGFVATNWTTSNNFSNRYLNSFSRVFKEKIL